MSRNPCTYVVDNSQPVHLWRAIKTDSNAWPTSKVTFLVRAVSHQEALFLAQHDPCVKSPADMVHVDFEPIKADPLCRHGLDPFFCYSCNDA